MSSYLEYKDITGTREIQVLDSEPSKPYIQMADGYLKLDSSASGKGIYIKQNGIAYKIIKEEPLALVSWADGTDEEIAAMVNAYYNGDITLTDIQEVWHVGDERSVSLSAMSATGVDESHRAQTVKMVILDFDHDTLTTSQGGKTKALVTLGQKDCLRDATVTDEQGSSNTEKGYINSSNTTVGGWTSCARRAWCNNGYYNALPSYLKSLVKPVNKLTSAGNKSTTINTDSDKVFLPSEIEIFGMAIYSAPGEGTQYSYYTTESNRYKLPKWGSSYLSGRWWERSPVAVSVTYFCAVYDYGDASSGGASFTIGIAPHFCI